MPFAAALSTAFDTGQAVEEVCWQAKSQLGGASPDLACVFFTPSHSDGLDAIARNINAKLQPGTLLGCLGESIAGGSREIEKGPGLVLWTAKWDHPVEIDSFHMTATRTGDGTSIVGWPDALFEANVGDAAMLLFGDPYTFPVGELFLPQMNEDYPGLAVIGGMASNPAGPGGACLIRNELVTNAGAVGVVLRGVKYRSVVSQGCKPIGRPMVVTKAMENVIIELGGQPPLEYLRGIYEELPARDKDLFQTGLLVGLALSEYRDTFSRGDFLIRNLYGIDKNTGAVAITDKARVGQTVQFQVRDSESADAELRAMLERDATNGKARSALMFSCNGRGSRLFGEPNHDAGLVQQYAGPLPLAGFFAAGELGPVGPLNYIHGFTASMILFE